MKNPKSKSDRRLSEPARQAALNLATDVAAAPTREREGGELAKPTNSIRLGAWRGVAIGLIAGSLATEMALADDTLVRVVESEPNVPLAIVEDAPNRVLLARPKQRNPAGDILAEERIKETARKLELKEKLRHRHLKWRKFELPPGLAMREAKRQMEATGEFDTVMEARTYAIHGTVPNDPLFQRQWGLRAIGAPVAWDAIHESQNVVAVVDTGIDFDHPDLRDNLWTGPNGEHGYTFADDEVRLDGRDDFGHGTHVAGIIAAVGNNAVGVSGVAWRTRLLSIKVLHGGVGNSVDIVNGLEKIVELKRAGVPIFISNHSYGGFGDDPYMAEGFALLTENDVFAAVSAGNANVDTDLFGVVPANFRLGNMVSTMASDEAERRATFSNFGLRNTDIAAPGVNILSTTQNGGYAAWSGTSMAAPHVAGLAQLLRTLNPRLSAVETRELLLDPQSYEVRPGLSLNNTGARLNVARTLSNPRIWESPFQCNRAPIATANPDSVLITDPQPVNIALSLDDPDGDTLRWWLTPLGFRKDYFDFVRQTVELNGFRLQSTPEAITLASPAFAWQLASDVQMSVSDNRGGGAVARTSLEIVKSDTLRRPIPIKTWMVRASHEGNYPVLQWILDVEDDAKTNYNYTVLVMGKNRVTGALNYRYTPSPDWTPGWWTSIPLDNITVRAVVMDRHLNLANSEPIVFGAPAPRCIASVVNPEGNVPFTATFDLSKSIGATRYVVMDFFGTTLSANKPMQTAGVTLPGFYLKTCWVLNSAGAGDAMVLPIAASRHAEFSDSGLPLPTLPPPTNGELKVVDDLALRVEGSTFTLIWTDRSEAEDVYQVEMRYKKGGHWREFSLLATLPPNSQGYSLRGSRRTNYEFRVRPCNNRFCADWSNLVQTRAR